MKKTRFSIIHFYDPYGDMKSRRKVAFKENYESSLSLEEVEKIISRYNGNEYYNAVKVGDFDLRIKKVFDFDTSEFINEKALEDEHMWQFLDYIKI